MLSLHIVGGGNENIHGYIEFLKNELKLFIKQNNVSFYNFSTLGKAETSPKLLKKNSRLILPSDKDASYKYWGFFDVNDWDALYSKLFSPLETEESSCYEDTYFTHSRLSTLLKQFADPLLKHKCQNFPYDFRIIYRNEQINTSDRICIVEIDINLVSFDAFEFFRRLVYSLDSFYSDVFLSAYIDDSYVQHFNFNFDAKMLTKRIINTGKAFYISNNLIQDDKITDLSILQQYNVSYVKNGNWFVSRNICKQSNRTITQIDDLLIPHYMVVNWSYLSAQTYLCIDDFDTISVYHDKYTPTDPTLILSRGYSSKQVDLLAREYGCLCFQERDTKNSLFIDP